MIRAYNLRLLMLSVTLVCVILAWQVAKQELRRLGIDAINEQTKRDFVRLRIQRLADKVTGLHNGLREALPEDRPQIERRIADNCAAIALLELQLLDTAVVHGRAGNVDIDLGKSNPTAEELRRYEALLYQLVKGSRLRIRSINYGGVSFPTIADQRRFRRLVETLGATNIVPDNSASTPALIEAAK